MVTDNSLFSPVTGESSIMIPSSPTVKGGTSEQKDSGFPLDSSEENEHKTNQYQPAKPSIFSSSNLKPCEICREGPSLYRCPRCSICTCSLQCCTAHKKRGKGCNGKRDRAVYCALQNFSDSQLSSDYHFLEDVLKSAQSGRRMLKSVEASKS